MGTMFDTAGDVERNLRGLSVDAVAAYGNGAYRNFPAAQEAFPRAHLLEIDVSGAGIGDAGDFERGDMPCAGAGVWAKRRLQAGVARPVVYFSVSNWEGVMQSLRAEGVSRERVRLWTAHYDGRAHRCSDACGFGVTGTADATQWGSSDFPNTLPREYDGRVLDVSMTAEDFWVA
jgi:hypothetical protein